MAENRVGWGQIGEQQCSAYVGHTEAGDIRNLNLFEVRPVQLKDGITLGGLQHYETMLVFIHSFLQRYGLNIATR